MNSYSEIIEHVSRGLAQAKEAEVKDIAIDLETLGTKPGAPIVAIGLAGFCRKYGKVYPLMYQTIDLESAIANSTGVDPKTLEWWLVQERDAVEQTFLTPKSRFDLFESLAQLTDIFEYLGNPKPWGNGATFDISLLEETFRITGQEAPWKYWNVRDCRTVVDLGRMILGTDLKKEMPFEGTKHNALFDAMHQASYTAEIISQLDANTMGNED